MAIIKELHISGAKQLAGIIDKKTQNLSKKIVMEVNHIPPVNRCSFQMWTKICFLIGVISLSLTFNETHIEILMSLMKRTLLPDKLFGE